MLAWISEQWISEYVHIFLFSRCIWLLYHLVSVLVFEHQKYILFLLWIWASQDGANMFALLTIMFLRLVSILKLPVYLKRQKYVVMEWSGRRTIWDHSRRRRQSGFIVQQTVFSTPKWSFAGINNRAARAAREARSRYNQIGPLDHKMAVICVFSAHTNTIFSTVSTETN